MSWGNREKYKIFLVPLEEEVRKIDKEGNGNIITIFYQIKLLIVRDLWRVHYQILSIISQKQFTRLNVKIMIVF